MSRIGTLEQILDTNEETTVYRVPSFGWGGFAIWLNLDRKPFDDKRIRQALSMAIDRRVVLEVVNRSDGVMVGPFPWALARYTEFEDYNLGPAFQYNPQEAERLLNGAVPGGLKVNLEWGELQSFSLGDYAVLVTKYWEDIVVDVNLIQLESGSWQSKRCGGAPIEEALVSFVNRVRFHSLGLGLRAVSQLHTRYHKPAPRRRPLRRQRSK